jgi:hypothetical protein
LPPARVEAHEFTIENDVATADAVSDFGDTASHVGKTWPRREKAALAPLDVRESAEAVVLDLVDPSGWSKGLGIRTRGFGRTTRGTGKGYRTDASSVEVPRLGENRQPLLRVRQLTKHADHAHPDFGAARFVQQQSRVEDIV